MEQNAKKSQQNYNELAKKYNNIVEKHSKSSKRYKELGEKYNNLVEKFQNQKKPAPYLRPAPILINRKINPIYY